MLDDYEQGRLSFVVPEFFFYEVASGIGKAVLRKEVMSYEAEATLDDLLTMEIEVHPLSKVKDVYFLSQTYKRSIYDCIYIDLAQRLGLEFWTADEKLYHAIKDKLLFVKWIGDYKKVNESKR